MLCCAVAVVNICRVRDKLESQETEMLAEQRIQSALILCVPRFRQKEFTVADGS